MIVLGGVALAGAAWAWLFAASGRRLWARSFLAGAAIGVYAVVAQRQGLDDLFRGSAADVGLGAISAAVLYGVFWLGDRLLRAWLPGVAAGVGDLYRLQAGASRRVMAASVVIVGSCEEIFWRGFVQRRVGLLGLIGYALVHVWKRSPALVLAAAVAGAFWAGLFAWRGNLVAPIVSHVLWDLAMVVWFPLRGGLAKPRQVV